MLSQSGRQHLVRGLSLERVRKACVDESRDRERQTDYLCPGGDLSQFGCVCPVLGGALRAPGAGTMCAVSQS
jgi:hypothetical protein